MTKRSRTMLHAAGLMLLALAASGMGRAPTTAAAAAAGPTIPVHLVVAIENLDLASHPIRITVDGQPVFRRSVRSASNITWWPWAGRSRRTVRLTAGAHQLEAEEELTHIVHQTQINVTRPCALRVGFWPWFQNGQFRQEPHFTVTLTPAMAKGAS